MGAETIVLVEDNPDDAALAQAAFARVAPGQRLVVIEDGETALQQLVGNERIGAGAGSLPALILLDLKLPGIDGFAVLRGLRADPRGAALPVVILTSSIEEPDLLESYRLGANSYVRKPVDFDEFIPVAEQLVRYWIGLNERPYREIGR